MQITALGHSCILLDFERPDGGPGTRILVDPWLSDHTTGDGMGRFPRLRFETPVLGPIHAIFISHAHSDHLDPYTLVRLWQELDTPPVLFLPATLSFLAPVFRDHLDCCDVRILRPQEPQLFRGVELFGFYDINIAPTNEDDVMVLVVRNETDIALVEADANLTLEHPELREFVSLLMSQPGIESAVFLTTENELAGTLPSKDCSTSDARQDLAEHAMNEMLDAVQDLYEPPSDPTDPTDLWQCRHLIRLVHGQGLTAPHELDPRWQRILFPVRIHHRVREEQATAARMGCHHHVDALTVGAVHHISEGQLQAVVPLEGLERLDSEDQRTFDALLPFFPPLPCAPLRTDPRSHALQHSRILALLNQRFLPYLHGSRQPSFIHLLSACGGTYRVRIHFGASIEEDTWDYVVGFDTPVFIEEPAGDALPHESYWANDLDDFLDGRCDEFSTFCRSPFSDPQSIRLRACLATPLLHADLVEKRVRLHFERAQKGLTPGSYVVPLYEMPPSNPSRM